SGGGSGRSRSYMGQAAEAGRMTHASGARWETPRITIKPYPACQLSHASLDALQTMKVQASEVRAIRFRLPEEAAEIVCRPEAAKRSPRTPYDAKFSLPWCAAALLVAGGLGTESFELGRIQGPEVLGLAGRVGYETYDPGVAAAEAPGRAEVMVPDGATRVGEVASSRGGPDHPLSEEQLLEKFRLNAGPGHEALAQKTLGLESLPLVADLAALIAGRVEVAR